MRINFPYENFEGLEITDHLTRTCSTSVEKAKVILVSTGISKKDAEKAGLMWAPTVQKAFEKALSFNGENASIAVLKKASRMLPLMNG